MSRPIRPHGEVRPCEHETTALKTASILCVHHRKIAERKDHLHTAMANVEAALVEHHDWFELTRVQRRKLPAAQALYDMEDEVERLGREGAKLVADLCSVPSVSMLEAIAKLELVARVIEPNDYPTHTQFSSPRQRNFRHS